MSVAKAKARAAVENKKQRKRGEGAAPSEALIEAKRTLAAEKLSQYVATVVATAPPLNEDQCRAIAAALWRQP